MSFTDREEMLHGNETKEEHTSHSPYSVPRVLAARDTFNCEINSADLSF